MLRVFTAWSKLGCSVTSGFYDNTLSKALIRVSAHILYKNKDNLLLTPEDRGHAWWQLVCFKEFTDLWPETNCHKELPNLWVVKENKRYLTVQPVLLRRQEEKEVFPLASHKNNYPQQYNFMWEKGAYIYYWVSPEIPTTRSLSSVSSLFVLLVDTSVS